MDNIGMLLSRSGLDSAVRRLAAAGPRARQAAAVLGAHLYTILVFAVAVGCLWLASTLSSARTLSEVKPALQTALAPLAELFGVAATAPAPDAAVAAHGQIVALDSFDVAARVSARVVSIADAGAAVAEGDIIARLDDASARSSLAEAERRLAEAREALASARAGGSSDAYALQRAYEGASIALSDVHLNFSWIFASARSVLHGTDLRESRGNAYIYADLVRTFEPDIDRVQQDALVAFERTDNTYANVAAAYRAIPRDVSGAELDAALAQAYDLLRANADTLKRIRDFLSVVREELENEEQDVPEELSAHEASIADALRTTNDNLATIGDMREEIRIASSGTGATDVTALERAVADATNDVAASRSALARYVVISPVTGVVADVQVPRGSAVVDGQVVATVMADETVARVAFSEADVAHAEVGMPVLLTLDGAGIELQGHILSVDSVATVTDGTVAFYALIAFPEDTRVRAGMSATARIMR